VDAERAYSEDRWYSEDRGYGEPGRRDPRGGGPGNGPDERMPAQRGYAEPTSTFPGFTPGGGYSETSYGGQPAPAYDPGPDPRSAAPTSGDPRAAGGIYGGRPGPDQAIAAAPRPERGSRSADEGVYRSRKPLHAAVLAIFLGLFELLVAIRFLKGIFNFDNMHPLLASGFTLMALPAFGIGFYALLTGAAHTGPRAFLKTPLAYLPVGLILLVAAGAAA
jgi:hypothetical protein